MTRIKLCGLTRLCDIEYANELLPEYIGFVFIAKSKRYITTESAGLLKRTLNPNIIAVGVFADEKVEIIADIVKEKIIGIVQLHGSESEDYIKRLRSHLNIPIIKAFQINNQAEVFLANKSLSDYVLLDSGGGTGKTFNHTLLEHIKRPYFLAGGITPENASKIIMEFKPFAVDASSSLETNGLKDKDKMTAFIKAVRKE